MKILTFIFLFFSIQCSSQTEFSRFYHDSLNSKSQGLGLTSDGGAILLGNIQNVSSNYTKVDSSGNVVWSKRFQINNKIVSLTNGLETIDSNYLISGAILNPSTGGGILIKTDRNGDTIWTRRFTDQFSLMEYSKLIETSDSCYLMHWSNFGFGAMNVVKVAASGSILWTKTFYSQIIPSYLFSCTELTDGSILFSGVGSSGSFPSAGFGVLLKLTSSGQISWYRRYGISNIFEALYAVGNEFRIISRTKDNLTDRLIFSKFDSLGNNYETFSDTVSNISYSVGSASLSSYQKVNDTLFHVNFFGSGSGSNLPLTITENAQVIHNPLPNYSMTAGSLITANNQIFQFGHVVSNETSQLRLSKTNFNSSLCSPEVTSYSLVSRPTFSYTDIAYYDTTQVQLIESDAILTSYDFSSYISCESQLSLSLPETFDFIIYPNPCKDYVVIESYFNEDFIVQISDFQGRILSQFSTKNGIINDVSELITGSYLFRLKSNNGTTLKTGKLIIDNIY